MHKGRRWAAPFLLCLGGTVPAGVTFYRAAALRASAGTLDNALQYGVGGAYLGIDGTQG